MNVGVAGAGAIAMGYAALLLGRGHAVGIWSPSGHRTAPLLQGTPLTVTGAIEGAFSPDVCKDAVELACNEVIVLALPAFGQRFVIDALVPHIEARHTVILSAHLSFAGLYLAKRLAERGLRIPIAVWNTTALTCKALSFTEVRIGALRSQVDVAVVPVEKSDYGRDLCADLFGERFVLKDDMLTVALSNLNPQSHLAIALCNLTRFEIGEAWGQRANVTPNVGRLIEALDRERLAIATAFGKAVSTVFDHYQHSFGVSGATVAEMSSLLVARGSEIQGPKTISSRYVLEDVPFGLVPMLSLADMVSSNVPLHRSGVEILSACYGRNFTADNDLFPDLGIHNADQLRRVVAHGY